MHRPLRSTVASMLVFALFVFMGLAISTGAQAPAEASTADGIVHVDPVLGNDGTADGTTAAPFQTIQAAVDFADTGETIALDGQFGVAGGTAESATIGVGKSLIFAGAGLASSSNSHIAIALDGAAGQILLGSPFAIGAVNFSTTGQTVSVEASGGTFTIASAGSGSAEVFDSFASSFATLGDGESVDVLMPFPATDRYTVTRGSVLNATAGGDPPGLGDNDGTTSPGAQILSLPSYGGLDLAVGDRSDGSFTYTHDGSGQPADQFFYGPIGHFSGGSTGFFNEQGLAGQAAVLTASQVAPEANPPLAASCGLDIMLVMDSSSSISDDQYITMQGALTGFVNAFAGTPTQFALVEFNTQAMSRLGLTNDLAAVTTEIGGPREVTDPVDDLAAAFTNYDHALNVARTSLAGDANQRVDRPDMIVFASDGVPTVLGDPGDPIEAAEGGVPDATKNSTWIVELEAGVEEANAAKLAGVRIQAFGIEIDSIDASFLGAATFALEQIASADAVTTTGFDELSADLSALALDLCGATISVEKVIDDDGNLGTTGDQTSGGAGWEFTANITGGGSVVEPTGDDGVAVLDLDLTSLAEVVVSESGALAGHDLVMAECTIDGESAGSFNPTTGELALPSVGPSDIVSCRFYNTPSPSPSPSPTATIQVVKDFQDGTILPVDDADVTLTIDGDDYPLSGDSATPAVEVELPATVTFDELVDATQWLFDSVACVAGETPLTVSGSGPYQVTLTEDLDGVDVICTFVNNRRASTLAVEKSVVNGDGETWQMSVNGVDIGEPIGDGGRVEALVPVGVDVTVEESGPTPETAEWQCFSGEGSIPDPGPGSGMSTDPFQLGDTDAVCLFTNTMPVAPTPMAKLRLVKDFVDDTILPEDDTATAKLIIIDDGFDVGDGGSTPDIEFELPATGIDFNEMIDETQWELSGLSCALDSDGSPVTFTGSGTVTGYKLDLPVEYDGDTVICTFTNTRLSATLTVGKTVVNDGGETWQISVNGVDIGDPIGNGGSVQRTVPANTPLTIKETGPAAESSAWDCSDDSDSGTVIPELQLTPSSSDTCTFTNTMGTTPPLFSKVFSPDSIDEDGTSTLEFSIDNTGSAIAATALDFTDNLPAGVVVAAGTPSTTCTGGTLTAVAGAAAISYTGGSVAAGDTCKVSVDVTSATAGEYLNTSGDLTSSLGNSGNATDSLTVVAPGVASIKIEKTPDEQTVVSGASPTFTITVTNDGDLDLENVEVSDPLASDCDAVIGNLAAGVTYSAYTCDGDPATASFTNTANVVGDVVGSDETVSDSDTAVVVVEVPGVASITIEKTPDEQTIVSGGTPSFTITVTNDGDVDLDNVEVADPLAPGCDRWIGDLAAGSDDSYSCDGETTTEGFTNTATATGDVVDSEDTVSDSDSAVVLVETPPSNVDLTVTKVVVDYTGEVDVEEESWEIEVYCYEPGVVVDSSESLKTAAYTYALVDTTIWLGDGESETFADLPPGVVCTVTEVDDQGADQVQGEIVGQALTADTTVTITNIYGSPPVTVVVAAPPPPITVTVTKVVETSGIGQAPPASTAFGFVLDCIGVDESFSLAAGESHSVSMPANTQCSLSETDSQGATSVSGEFSGVLISTSSAFTVTNTYHLDEPEVLGTSITKTLTSADPAAVGEIVTFDVAVTFEGGPLRNLELMDSFDSSVLEFVSATVGGAAIDCTVLPGTPRSTLACDLGEASGPFTVRTQFRALHATTPGSTLNTASVVYDPDGDGPVASETIGPVSDDLEVVEVLALPPLGDGDTSPPGGVGFGFGLALAAALGLAVAGAWRLSRASGRRRDRAA